MSERNKLEAERWLEQAIIEYGDAELLLEHERYYLVLYLAHQVAEKALKAFIYLTEPEPLLTHSIAKLLEIAVELDADFEELGAAKRLDIYYQTTRYPNGLPGEVPGKFFDNKGEAKQALFWSSEVLALVKEKMLSNIKKK